MKVNINLLCRICGQEDKNCAPVFSEDGRKQAIQKKIRTCLNLSVEETDFFPKQLCISCLNKLEIAWNLFQLCQEGQIIIGKKLDASNHSPKNHESYVSAIKEKVKGLKENEKVLLCGTSVIFVVPPTEPSAEDEAPAAAPIVASSSEMLAAQPGPLLVNSAPVSFMQSPIASIEQAPTISAPIPINDGVYPESLIQVNPTSKPVVYHSVQQREQRKPPIPAPRRSVPAPKILPSPRRNIPSSNKRRALKEGDNSGNIQQSKKRSNQMCRYCNKSFPDDIIDHHVNLHLRQSFITCIECNKNFRSEEAMSRHRCGVSDSINLDSDEDEPICL